jgi:L-asparaginase
MKRPLTLFQFILMVNLAFVAIEVPAQSLPTVVVVTTGGTIAEKIDPATGAAVPAVSGKDLISAVPGLEKIANIRTVEYSNIDSSHMTPQMWVGLSKKVDEVLKDPKVKGVVITHGTDTIAEGAYFLDLTLKSKKPVVFVGAMRNASDVSPDGPANILDAVTQVCSDKAAGWGVTVTMNQYINAAKSVRKVQTSNVQAFNSGEKGYLGYIAVGKVEKFNDRPAGIKLPIPKELPKVILIKTFAGDDGALVKFAADQDAKGIVIEGVGAGNVNPQVADAIKYALDKDVVVVLSTRVYNGDVLPVYGVKGGGASLVKQGVILGGNIPAAKDRLLLMLAIPQARGNHDQLQQWFDS